VSVVDPDFGRYSEENPQDITHGESFSAAVVNAVTRGPAWESTLLLWGATREAAGLLQEEVGAALADHDGGGVGVT
jgi:hypothetical protein